jgi:hypothetical protein
MPMAMPMPMPMPSPMPMGGKGGKHNFYIKIYIGFDLRI